MTDQRSITRQLKQSLDMMVYRRGLIAVTLGVVVGMIYAVVRFRNLEPMLVWIIVSAVTAGMVPIYAAWGFRIWRLFRRPQGYFFTRAELTAPHQGWRRGNISLTAVIDDPEEGTFVARTNPIFHTRGIEKPQVEDYINRTVTIGYNRETGVVVVTDRN